MSSAGCSRSQSALDLLRSADMASKVAAETPSSSYSSDLCAVIHAPKDSLQNAIQSNNCWCLPVSTSRNAQLTMKRRDFGCWRGARFSHIYWHAGLPGHGKSREVMQVY